MSITKLADGQWKAEAYITAGNKPRKTFNTKAEAVRWKTDMLAQRNRGKDMTGPSKVLLSAVIDAYIEKNGGTWGRDKQNHLDRIRAEIGNKRLDQLDHDCLYNWIADLDFAPANARSHFSYLLGPLKYARPMGLKARRDQYDEARETLAEQKIIGSSVARTRRATQDEIDAVIANISDHGSRTQDLEAVVEVLSRLPIRVGELCKLTWDDVNTKDRTITLRERKHPDQRIKLANTEVVAPMTIGGKDTFLLIAQRRLTMGQTYGPFPYDVQALSRLMKQTCDRAGIKDLHLHDLRAHAISAMLEAGVMVADVMQVSGHKNMTTFYKHYVRLLPTQVRERIEAKMGKVA